jgi:hypothetical protein
VDNNFICFSESRVPAMMHVMILNLWACFAQISRIRQTTQSDEEIVKWLRRSLLLLEC